MKFLIARFSIAAFSASTLAPALAFGAPPFSDKPFWEGKPKLEAKLRDDRAVLVSARTEKGVLDPQADLFTINGVGWVRREPGEVFQLAGQFDRLKEISDVFREVKFDPAAKRVFVICQALGYQARMLFSVETVPGPIRELRFKVVDGHFLGLEGVMGFKEVPKVQWKGKPQTEVSLRVHHEAREIPIPKVLVGFALEVLVQKVAQKMRTHFEEAKMEATVVPPESAKLAPSSATPKP